MSTIPALWLSALLLAACVPLGMATTRAPLWARLGWQAVALLLLSLLLAPVLGSPLAPEFAPRFGPTRLLEQLLAIGWWLLVARVAVLLARGAMALGNPSREARILTDLVAGAIQLAVALAVIAFVFALPVRGLLATSGVVAIVLGLALQNTLGDLFSGIAVGAERPYKPGDTLSVDGVTGRVTEINWRSTHLKVGQDVAIVPNSVVARGRLLNRSAPLAATSEVLELKLDPGIPPEDALVVLDAALHAGNRFVPGIEPGVTCTALAGDGTTFALQFAAASSDVVGQVRSEMLARVHRHLRFAGMRLAIPGQAADPPVTVVTPLGVEDLLAHSALFGAMTETHRTLLGRRFNPIELAVGDLLFSEGDRPEALFMIAAGVIDMITGPVDAPTTRYRLSPGETIGAVALITGSAQRATARAATIARAFKLDENDLAACLDGAPELATDLEQTVDRAMRAMARQAAARGNAAGEASDVFSGRLRIFVQRLISAGRAR
ncbi:mechanosensitive ion channel domain-containing protein [Lichenicola sp.]|uniref:mechanosensitive ion channel domain-containing protein n=1 Tax=Lichenicola sp. TaxID=2804529 RepID=UPI003B00691A